MSRQISKLVAFFVFFLGGCFVVSPQEQKSVMGERVLLYRGGDTEREVMCFQGHGSLTECGTGGYDSEVLFFECSSDEYRCVASSAMVFAVPVSPERITQGELYTYFGAEFRVKSCLPRPQQCDLAYITVECRTGDFCRAEESATGRFFYSKEKGIVSFVTLYSTEEHEGIGWDENIMSELSPILSFYLVAGRGFLSSDEIQLDRVSPTAPGPDLEEKLRGR